MSRRTVLWRRPYVGTGRRLLDRQRRSSIHHLWHVSSFATECTRPLANHGLFRSGECGIMSPFLPSKFRIPLVRINSLTRQRTENRKRNWASFEFTSNIKTHFEYDDETGHYQAYILVCASSACRGVLELIISISVIAFSASRRSSKQKQTVRKRDSVVGGEVKPRIFFSQPYCKWRSALRTVCMG